MNRSLVTLMLVATVLVLASTVPLSLSRQAGASSVHQQALSVPVSLRNPGEAGRQLSAAQPVSDTVSSVFLPVAYRRYTACPPNSPFSLEIAAIHQVVPDGEAVGGTLSQAEAQWVARLEAGFPSLVEAMIQSGACWTRLEVSWARIQPVDDPAGHDWDWFDERLALVAGAGVEIIAIVDKVPEWAGERERGPIDDDRLDEFADFLTAAVHRYKKPPYSVRHWELFNEPDVVGGYGLAGERYAQMLSVAYSAIKAADPGAIVLLGGLAYDDFAEAGGPFNRYFLDDVMAAGGDDHVDVTNFHFFPGFAGEWERWDPDKPPSCGVVDDGQGTPYWGGGTDLIAKYSHFRARLDTCFEVDKPIWVTELGEHGFANNAWWLDEQSRYVIQGYVRGLAAGAKNITWFALVSPPYDPWQQGLLFEHDWSPKPAYYTYQTLTSELWSYEYAETLDVKLVEGYVFRSGSRPEKTVAWSTRADGKPPLVFENASELRVVHRLGEVTFVRDGGPGDKDGVQNGQVRLQLSQDPVIVSRD